jgi:hypothetical protein
MFSLSLATGLQPVLAPVTPYSFVAANMNALLAQLLFVFLSGSGNRHPLDLSTMICAVKFLGCLSVAAS